MSHEYARSIEVLSSPVVRVSCCGLIRIEDAQGKLLLLVNKGTHKYEDGKRVLTPVGGAIELTPEGKVEIERVLGITTFEQGDDMRFTMEGMHANVLRRWFLARKGRELHPLRELCEELIDEPPHLLTHPDLIDASAELRGYYSYIGPTVRSGYEGINTLSLNEIFDVSISAEAEAQLHKASEQEEAWVHFVTEDEIRRGMTYRGVKIASNVIGLLDTEPHIKEFS